MANYLERVASSAGRRAAIARPPASGPPVLPAGRDFSIAPADPFASDEAQFLDTLETHAPARTQESAEIASTTKSEITQESSAPRVTTSAAPHEPKPNPRPPVERLSSESPVTVHLPRTLRPISTANVPAPAPAEAPRRRASTPVVHEEFTTNNEPTPLAHTANTDVGKESANTTTDTPAQPETPVPDRVEQVLKPVHTETLLPDTTPIPRVDRAVGPAGQTAEPSPPPAMPVHLPPAASNTTRQEQSRISIGSLEVLVNNHPRVTTTRPAAAPSRSERLNLEKRYLDRFRLRH